MSFWDFNPWDKHDEIIEGRHDHLYYGALSDPETGIEYYGDNTYIIYGHIEALLMRPTRKVFRMGLDLLGAFLSLVDHE